jgi:glyoxylase I family protein
MVLLCMEVGTFVSPMPARGIQHVDLAVSDVERSISFYRDVLGPLGFKEEARYPSYRGSEEVVYFHFGEESLGLRPADGGELRYYDVGLEHLAFQVDTRAEVDEAHQRCLERGDRVHHSPEVDRDIDDYYAFFVFDPDGFRIEVFCRGPVSPASRDHQPS